MDSLYGVEHTLAVQTLALIAENCSCSSSLRQFAEPSVVQLLLDSMKADVDGLSDHCLSALLNMARLSKKCNKQIVALNGVQLVTSYMRSYPGRVTSDDLDGLFDLLTSARLPDGGLRAFVDAGGADMLLDVMNNHVMAICPDIVLDIVLHTANFMRVADRNMLRGRINEYRMRSAVPDGEWLRPKIEQVLDALG